MSLYHTIITTYTYYYSTQLYKLSLHKLPNTFLLLSLCSLSLFSLFIFPPCTMSLTLGLHAYPFCLALCIVQYAWARVLKVPNQQQMNTWVSLYISIIYCHNAAGSDVTMQIFPFAYIVNQNRAALCDIGPRLTKYVCTPISAHCPILHSKATSAPRTCQAQYTTAALYVQIINCQ